MNPKLINALPKFAVTRIDEFTMGINLNNYAVIVTGFCFRPAQEELEAGNFAVEVFFVIPKHEWIDPSSVTTVFKFKTDDYHQAAKLFIERVNKLEPKQEIDRVLDGGLPINEAMILAAKDF